MCAICAWVRQMNHLIKCFLASVWSSFLLNHVFGVFDMIEYCWVVSGFNSILSSTKLCVWSIWSERKLFADPFNYVWTLQLSGLESATQVASCRYPLQDWGMWNWIKELCLFLRPCRNDCFWGFLILNMLSSRNHALEILGLVSLSLFFPLILLGFFFPSLLCSFFFFFFFSFRFC